MIPLRTPAKITKVPLALLIFCAGSLLLSLFLSSPSMAHLFEGWGGFVLSFFVFPSRFLAVVCLWYFWIFYPAVFNRIKSSKFADFVVYILALGLAYYSKSYALAVPVIFLWTTLYLGFAMSDQIWENVDTLVLGPRIFSVYEVPCYVHVFFFFFYLFLSNLISPMSSFYGKSFYLLALVSFIAGFLIRLLELKVLKDDPKSI